MDARLNCFIIGPIGDKFAPVGSPGREIYEEALDVYENVIVPACELNDLEPVRADQIAVAGEITEQVVRHLLEDPLVIADVSGGNPNVMYELGIRHATGRPTIHLGEYAQLPFDISVYRTILFSRSERGLVDARKKLESAVAAALVDGSGPVTAARLWQERRESLPSRDLGSEDASDADVLVPDDAPGFFEMLADVNDEFPVLAAGAHGIAEAIEQIGIVTAESTSELHDARDTTDVRGRLSIITRYAARLAEPAETIEDLTDEFVQRLTTLDRSMLGIAAFLSDHPDVWDAQQVREFHEMVATLATAGREGMEGVNTLATAAEGLGAISKELRVPGRRIATAVKRMAKAVGLMDNWEAALGKTMRDRGVERAS